MQGDISCHFSESKMKISPNTMECSDQFLSDEMMWQMCRNAMCDLETVFKNSAVCHFLFPLNKVPLYIKPLSQEITRNREHFNLNKYKFLSSKWNTFPP